MLYYLNDFSTASEYLEDYTSLKDVALRSKLDVERGLYLAESTQVIRRALAAGHQPRSFLLAQRWLPDLSLVFESNASTGFSKDGGPIPVFIAPEELLHQLVGFHLHRGAISSMQRPVLPTAEQILRNDAVRRVLILENLVDHTNVGAAFRSAAACGYDAIFVTPSCADPLYRRSVRVSMGSVFSIGWTRLNTWPDWDLFHDFNFEVAALALSKDAVDLSQYQRELCADPDRKVALVAGSEGPGLKANTIDGADRVVSIAMHHGIDSLNVAAACALACWATRTSQ